MMRAAFFSSRGCLGARASGPHSQQYGLRVYLLAITPRGEPLFERFLLAGSRQVYNALSEWDRHQADDSRECAYP